ncbi:MAG: hypothetical protein LBH29_04235, partial [Elusimicrobiota bacterium]|nr:hypothetical protein [Elusimicrobiota bacterium]
MKKIMSPLLFCFLFFCAELQTFAAAVDISSWSYLNDELIDGSDIDLAGDIIYFGSIYTSAASSIRGGNGSASFALNGRKLFNAIVSSSPSKISFEGNIVFTLFNGVSSGGALGAFGYGAGFSFADSLINLNSNAASFGGAVSAFSMSFVKADNSSISFVSNTSLNNGGAIYAAQSSSISMSSSKISFEKNAALGKGGAVFISFSTWTLNSVNASFISNRGDIGGGIYGENSLLNFSASNFVFASNMSRNANGMGAALYLENSSADFVNSNAVFNLNYGSRFGSAVYLDNSDINFIRSEIIFSSNNAREGGAIYAKNKSLINMEIQNGARIVFNNNTANRGADIYFSNSRLNINLGAGASAELNGGIYAENLGVFQIYGSGSGGAVYLRGDNYLTGISSFSLKSVALRVENSFVYSSGAAIYADRADLTFNGGSFLFNANSGDFGGVFNIEDSNAVFSGSAAFAGNSAQNGGVFYIKDSNIVFEKSLSFTRNSAQSGGALYLDGSSAVFKGSAAFIQNDAADAVIYARDRSILTFTADAGDIVFSNNNAPVSLYLDGGNNAVIFNAASQNKIEIAGIRTLDGDIIVKNGAGFLIVETDRGFGIQGEFNLNEGFLNIRTRFIDIRVLNMQANSSIKMENPNFVFRSSAGYLNTADAAATLYTDQLSARSASFYFNLYFNGRD